ncbi:biliverdin-producing heme oxygenase [Luteimonas sp. JM171]|uniref:biliverdin-producing heme oxygenase n=1 Tax=Luteimonas sp. JM171 TaxID=1896164 RepID=UPI000857066E|nr:biliverdin-producing heme oxygenase [Luteimonas sp. JM171]AOH37253.1 hypothetical protein BGP89_13605 [Luteimonas sp. JM171]
MEPSAPRPATGLTSQLRAATRGTHDHVDAAFPAGLDSPAVYVRYLQAILPLAQWLHRAWQPDWQALACWHAPERPQQLREDLRRLDTTPTAFELPADAISAAEWLGASYVMEGSAMGARLLARDLDRLQAAHPHVADARSFIDSQLADPRRWGRFRQVLDALPEADASDALRGARRGFGLVEHQLDAMEAPA